MCNKKILRTEALYKYYNENDLIIVAKKKDNKFVT